jgi:rhamnose transport system ATP-binding protein
VTSGDAPLVVLTGITKHYAGVRALDDVSVEIHPGEVHALVGENGAGKSTLTKVLAGAVWPDAGEVRWKGAPVVVRTPAEAQRLGVATIHQELYLAPNLSVAENVFLGRPPRTRAHLVDWRRLRRETAALLDEWGFELDPGARVGALSVARQQLVAIVRALSRRAELVLMDEATSALTDRERERLFAAVRALTARGVAVVYVSHRLEEIFQLGHRITVLRGGQCVGTRRIADVDAAEVVAMMVGRRKTPAALAAPAPGAVVLAVDDLCGNGVDNVSFTLRRGEVVGVAGLVGAGRTGLVRALFGAPPPRRGRVLLDGHAAVIRSPRQAVRLGIALVPEDRRAEGLFLTQNVRENIVSATLGAVSRLGIVRPRRERTVAARFVDALAVRTPGLSQLVLRLSGGNQQKVVVARWLAARPRVLLLDEPTRGVDVGAKSEIHALIRRLVADGMAVLLVSSEIPELLAVCDRILVMHRGRLVATFDRASASAAAIVACAHGHRLEADATPSV